MKRLYLHIGFNKTGSTSLQQCLYQNRAVLETSGYLYPGTSQDSYMQNQQHTPLAASLPNRTITWLRPRKQATLDQALPDLLAAIAASPASSVILSSEAFGGLDMTPEGVRLVAEKLGQHFDLCIIAYIRRQDSYLLSAYQEEIKNGGSHSFAFDRYPANRQLYFNRRLAPWRDVFGAERVIVRPFDPKFWPDSRLEYDFLDAIGAPRAGIEPLEKPANESLDIETVEFLRQLNLLNKKDHGGPLSPRRTRQLGAAFNQLLTASEAKQKMILSSEQAETLRLHFRDDNVAALAGSGIAVDDFFPPQPPGRAARLQPTQLDPLPLLRLILAQQEQLPS